jgi:DNA-binding MurR/RpiR family transcriptional regulator
VARSAFVQPSTLVRFARALGYAGFSNPRAVFRAHAWDRWPDYRGRLHELPSDLLESGPSGLLARFARTSRISIGRLPDTSGRYCIAAGMEVLARADTLYLLGARRAFPVVTYLTSPCASWA